MKMFDPEGAFAPHEVQTLGTSFDRAWEEVAANFAGSDAETIAHARDRLARLVLTLSKTELTSLDELETRAVRVFDAR